jgi:hypothetical protein
MIISRRDKAMSHSTEVPVRLSGGRLVGMLGSQVVVGALVAAAFVGLYVGLQRDPQPHGLPVAVVGAELADAAADAWEEKAAVVEAADADAARQLLEDHRAVAAVVPGGDARGLDLLVAGASGRSAVGAATALAAGLADAADLPLLSSTDVVPFAEHDVQGLSGFYLVFGVTLASFVLAQIMYSIAALVRLRSRVVTLVVGATAVAVVAAVLAGPVYGAVPADIAAVIPVLGLLGIGVSMSTLAVASLVGPLGNIASTIVFTTLGNAASGATVSAFLMPPVLAGIGAALPPGAAFRAVADVGYFDGGSVVVLLVWVAVAGTALAVHARRGRGESR